MRRDFSTPRASAQTAGVLLWHGNMDIRSFELNFEVNAVIYNQKITEQMEEIFINDLKSCREITRETYEARGLVTRFKEQCSRLLSPLL